MQVAPPAGIRITLSPYISIVMGITLSAIFCLAAGLCHRYGRLQSESMQVAWFWQPQPWRCFRAGLAFCQTQDGRFR